MKYNFTKIFCTVFLCTLILVSCKDGGKAGSGSSNSTGDIIDKDSSYSLGMSVGLNMKDSNIIPDIDEFMLGMKDVLQGDKTRFTIDDAMAKLQATFEARAEKENEEYRLAETEFLAENSKKEGIKVTSSGLQYEVISDGTGTKPGVTDTVRVHYEGTFIDGTVFDSSYARNEPVEFPLAEVIPGWTEGIQLMSEGSNYRFYIPSELAYGTAGINQVIPPYSTLIFNVELISIVR